MKPTTGMTISTTIQPTLRPVEALLRRMVTIDQMWTIR
jgi:hypothetical protein